jgi:co-chaperonin GroES (HSP10)
MKVPNPIGHYLLIEREVHERIGLISIPDRYQKHVKSHAKLLGIGHKCGYQFTIGDTVFISKAPEGKELWVHPDNKNIELIHENDVFAIQRGRSCFPLKNTVLLERFANQTKAGKLYLPDRANVQNLYGSFITLGMASKPFKVKGLDKLRFGDLIKISKWDASHIEVMLKNRYCLIINEKFIEAKFHELVPEFS